MTPIISYNKKMGYVPAFDGLRAISIFVVMLVHAHFQLGKNGQIGVAVFFTLSGFLITTLLVEEFKERGDVSLRAFYVRRVMRLFPALYVLLVVVFLFAVLFKSGIERADIFNEIMPAALYLYNISWAWGWGKSTILLGHTWSLAVEEQFYLIWPILLIAFLKRGTIKWLIVLLPFFILVSFFLKSNSIYPNWFEPIIEESIFIGCLGALLYHYGRFPVVPKFVGGFIFIAIVVLGVMPYYITFPIFDLVGFAVIFTIIGIIQHPSSWINHLLSNNFLVFIGKISYSLYLWHLPVFRWFAAYSTFPPSVSLIGKFLVTGMVATLSYYAIEKWTVKLGRKWSKRVMANEERQFDVEPCPVRIS